MPAFGIESGGFASRASAFLYNDFGSGWEWWPDFDRFHQIAIDELNAFNYEE
jgi:ribose 5-phosphate isomerase B